MYWKDKAKQPLCHPEIIITKLQNKTMVCTKFLENSGEKAIIKKKDQELSRDSIEGFKVTGVMMKKRAGIVFLAIMLLLSGFALGQKEIQAAERPYEINITKVSPKTAEKKLRKIKADSKRPLYLKVKAANEKDARKKIRSWMKNSRI